MVRSDNPTLISNKRIEKNPTGWYIQRVRLNKLGQITLFRNLKKIPHCKLYIKKLIRIKRTAVCEHFRVPQIICNASDMSG